MESTHAPETAIADLQVRLTYQEDDLSQLNLTVARQQQEIDSLRQELQRLRELIASQAQNGSSPAPAHESPPHY
ncbi:SlyX family protein [Thiorhodococcus fuscus]|uniref:SlyX family protein n=1 Tax=Thiorhodococcus fuscus TaxID=527200 RepID=A0ABW4Y6I1_9GAMM